jgi:hypothetical protein
MIKIWMMEMDVQQNVQYKLDMIARLKMQMDHQNV